MTTNHPAPAGDSAAELRQKLAAIEHERWTDWQKYMHSKLENDLPFGWHVKPDDYQHWERQIATPYASLSEHEKSMDMEQVDRYWPLIKRYVVAEQVKLLNAAIAAVGEDETTDYQSEVAQSPEDMIRNKLRAEIRTALHALRAELAALEGRTV